MGSGRHLRSVEASGETRLLFRIARRQPRAVQHGTGFEAEAPAAGQAVELLCLSLRGSGRTGVRKRVTRVLILGCRAYARDEIADLPPSRQCRPIISPGPGSCEG